MANRLSDAELILRAMPEKELLENVRRLVYVAGGLTYHTHDSRFSEKGFPDLTIVIHGRVLFSELKSQVGKTSAHQVRWLDRIAQAGGEAYLWRPQHWVSGEIERVLQYGPVGDFGSRWKAA